MSADDLENRVKVLEDAERKRKMDKETNSCMNWALLIVHLPVLLAIGYLLWQKGGDRIFRHEVERLRAVVSEEEK